MNKKTDWVPLFALPSRDWGSVSIHKLKAIANALDVPLDRTELSVFFDDLNQTWFSVMVPPDAVPEAFSFARIQEMLEEEKRQREEATEAVEEPPPAIEAPPTLETPQEKAEDREERPKPECVKPADNIGTEDTPPAEPVTLPDRFCRKCGRECPSPSAARLHEDNDHGHPDERACDECGWVFTSSKGLHHHHSMKHGEGGRKPIPGALVVEEEGLHEEPARTTLALVCTEPACGFTTKYAVDLNTHAVGAHGRRATVTERMPVPVSQANGANP